MANSFINMIKLITAINLLASSAGTTVKELMDKLKVSRRTAFRFLNALTDLGFPITDEQYNPRVDKSYRLLDSFILKLPNINILNPNLTEQELEYLLDILNQFETTKQSKKISVIKSIRAKLIALHTWNKET